MMTINENKMKWIHDSTTGGWLYVFTGFTHTHTNTSGENENRKTKQNKYMLYVTTKQQKVFFGIQCVGWCDLFRVFKIKDTKWLIDTILDPNRLGRNSVQPIRMKMFYVFFSLSLKLILFSTTINQAFKSILLFFV